MKFRSEIEIGKSLDPVEHNNKTITIGSCFAENIAEYFRKYRFNILANPFGVLYNPISIYNSLKLASEEKEFNESDLIYDQSEWHSFYHHSDFSHHDINVCLDNINSGIKNTNSFLQQCDVIIITYGTAFVYRHNRKEIIVSNCHKIPSSQFDRFRLTLEQTKEAIKNTIALLKAINNDVKIIFTVSPVRHWKDGAEENQISKSTLLLAINDIVSSESRCEYFPSYEIVMDDLRDYRFYEADLFHPNKLATDYIWEKFRESIFSENCKTIMNEVGKIAAAKNHKVRNNFSEQHQEFLKVQIDKIKTLVKKYPHLNMSDDKNYFTSQLKK